MFYYILGKKAYEVDLSGSLNCLTFHCLVIPRILLAQKYRKIDLLSTSNNNLLLL